MKDFFKNILNTLKNVYKFNFSEHQGWLFFGTLILGILLSLITGLITTIILTSIVVILSELIYCFVPRKSVVWGDMWFFVPDFKEFKKNTLFRILNPIIPFDIYNLYYMFCALCFVILFKLIFLIW